MKNTAALAIAIFTLTVAAVPLAPQASAGPAPANVVLFVIDLSGSMNEAFDAEQSKLDASKAAFRNAFSNAAGVGGQFGVRSYGDQFPSRSPEQRQQNCTEDTRTVIALGDQSGNVGGVVAEIDGLQAQGDTPIGLALLAAADDIPEGSLGTIVLFSDGRDECSPHGLGPDPCEVAATLKERSIDIKAGVSRVETIGLLPDQEADTQLQCVADVSGGTYTPIRNAEELVAAEDLLADLTAPRQAVRLSGIPLEGGTGPDDAPDLPDISDGRTEEIINDTMTAGEERWYHTATYGPGAGNITATAFDLPAKEGITFGLRAEAAAGANVTTSALTRTDEDAGLPRSPSVSVRCPGCSFSGGETDVFWVVSLESTDELVGEFDLELQIAGPAFRGPSTSCTEPQECFFEGEVQTAEVRLAELRAQLDEAFDESDADAIEQLEEVEARNSELQGELASAAEAEPRTSWLIPGVLAAVVAVLCGLLMFRRIRSGAPTDG